MKKSLRLALLTVVFSAFSLGGVNAQTTYTVSLNNGATESQKGYFTINAGGGYNNRYTGTYNGTSYTKGLKINSKGSIGFTTSNTATVTVIQSTSNNGTINIGLSDGANSYELNPSAEKKPSYTFSVGTADETNKYREWTISNLPKGTYTLNNAGGEWGCFYVAVTEEAGTEPSLNVNPSKLDLTVVPSTENKTVTSTLTILGSNLTAGATGTISLNPAVDGLSIDPTSFTVGADGKVNATVTLTYAPTADAKGTTSLTATVGDKSDNVEISYSANLEATVLRTISETTTWDFSKTGLKEIKIQPTERTIYSDLGATTSADFAADAISIQLNSTSGNALENGENCRIGSASNNARALYIHPTVAGTIEITFASTNNTKRATYVNGKAVGGDNGKTGSTQITVSTSVVAGDVYISGDNWIKVYKIVFTPAQAETATISAAGYATYVTKGNVDFFGETTLKAYAAKYDATAQKITLTAVTAAPANTPLVLKGAAGDYTLTAATEAPAAVSNNDLKAATAAVNADGSQWILVQLNGGVGFAKCTPNTTIAAGKAYLLIPATTTAKSFIGFGEDTTNGIASVISEEASMKNARVYNLAGQQVNKAYKGVVIVNGKKYIQK